MASGRSGWTLTWAVRLMLAEAVAVGLLTALSIWAAVTTSNVTIESAIATSGFIALSAVVLAALGLALARKKALARGPAIVLQMLLIPLGYYMVAGGLAWVGVPVMVIGVVGSGLLLAPATRAALGLF